MSVDAELILASLPYGVLLIDSDQRVVFVNSVARELLPSTAEEGSRCHQLFRCCGPKQPCEPECLVRRASASEELPPEVRLDVRGAIQRSAVWAQFAAAREYPGAIVQLRLAHPKDRRRRSVAFQIDDRELRIRALGPMTIDFGCGDVVEPWLGERPGQVLKYLVCHRDSVARTDAIAEALWPRSGSEALPSVRHAIHRLRTKLEPSRITHGKSSFIAGVPGGYALDRRNIWIDAVEFEELVADGLARLAELDLTAATAHLERALELYRGPFLAEEPYADWAFNERNRLQKLAEGALRALAALARERGDSDAATGLLDDLCTLEPYDHSAHRELVTALCVAGRLGDAKRRYTAYAHRMKRDFDAEPGFDLRSLSLKATSSG